MKPAILAIEMEIAYLVKVNITMVQIVQKPVLIAQKIFANLMMALA